MPFGFTVVDKLMRPSSACLLISLFADVDTKIGVEKRVNLDKQEATSSLFCPELAVISNAQ
jgi:hypothetical protein